MVTHARSVCRHGKPTVVFAIESQVDELAEKLSIDPIDFRMRNVIGEALTALSGAKITSLEFVDCLQAVRARIDWDRKRTDPSWHTPPQQNLRRGIGCAVAVQGSGVYLFENANESGIGLDLFADGHIRIRYASQDAGTGQRTVIAQCVAEELGVELDDVDVVLGETSTSPVDMGAWSSRGTHMSAHAARLAAEQLREDLLAAAADKLGTTELTLSRGMVHAPDGSISYGDLASTMDGFAGDCVSRDGQYVDPIMEPATPDGRSNLSPSYVCAAHAAEVEVDLDTGKITVLRYVAAHDVGTAINPTAVDGQLIGSVAMGIGGALGEELVLCEGHIVNGAYIDYALPRAADLPDIEVVLVESSDAGGPYGAKGSGEIGIIPVAPAIANAVYDAIGVRLRDLPMTPDKVITAVSSDRLGRNYHVARRPTRWEVAVARWFYPHGLHWALDTFGRTMKHAAPVRSVISKTESADAVMSEVRSGAKPIGGGTDAIVLQKLGFTNRARFVSTKFADGLDHVTVEADRIVVGAGATLVQLADEIDELIPGARAAIEKIATPQVRQMATVGGNLLQAKRCWFYRSGLNCYKRGGVTRPCYAVLGDHRFYHAAIDAHRCQAVTPSDLASLFAVLDATVVIQRRSGQVDQVQINRFYTGPGESVLRDGDLVTSVAIPFDRGAGCAVRFEKLTLWSGDFSIVSAAVRRDSAAGTDCWRNTRVVLGGLAPTPYRVTDVERLLDGSSQDPDLAFASLMKIFEKTAHPLARNEWKLDAAGGLLKRAIRDLSGPTISPP